MEVQREYKDATKEKQSKEGQRNLILSGSISKKKKTQTNSLLQQLSVFFKERLERIFSAKRARIQVKVDTCVSCYGIFLSVRI